MVIAVDVPESTRYILITVRSGECKIACLCECCSIRVACSRIQGNIHRHGVVYTINLTLTQYWSDSGKHNSLHHFRARCCIPDVTGCVIFKYWLAHYKHIIVLELIHILLNIYKKIFLCFFFVLLPIIQHKTPTLLMESIKIKCLLLAKSYYLQKGIDLIEDASVEGQTEFR